MIAALHRGLDVLVPGGDDRLEPGDDALVIGKDGIIRAAGDPQSGKHAGALD